MTFSETIWYLKQGKKAFRRGWNGKNMFLYMQEGSEMAIENCRNPVLKEYMEEQGLSSIKVNAHIDMKCADGSVVIGWLASQTDMLAEDWNIVGAECDCPSDCTCRQEQPEESEEPDGE